MKTLTLTIIALVLSAGAALRADGWTEELMWHPDVRWFQLIARPKALAELHRPFGPVKQPAMPGKGIDK